MKKEIIIFASSSVVVSFILFSFVSAAPGPWGIAINEKTHECGGFWGGDEFTILVLPAGWEDIYSWSDNWTKMGNVSECYLNGEPGPYQTNDSKICCEKNGYKFISKNVGIESNSSCKSLYWFDNDNKSCGQKEFCGMYMYYGLQAFESKEQCEKALETADGMTYEEYIEIYGGSPNKTKECTVDSDCPQVDCLPEEDCIDIEVKCINGKCKEQKTFCPEGSAKENGNCMFIFSNGRKAEIKIMPETASQTAIDRLGELGFYTIELKEVGKGEDAKPTYEIISEKQGKMLGLLKVKAKIKTYIDAQTGEIVKIKKPWWAFLASGLNKK